MRIQKEIEITMQGGAVHLTHRLINRNRWAVELAPWCLSVMAEGRTRAHPAGDFIPHPAVLIPARPLVLWYFTRMDDPRFIWGDRLIQLRDYRNSTANKNLEFEIAWDGPHTRLAGIFLLKSNSLIPDAMYPDMGCNFEFFTMPGFLEVENLGPLVKLEPNAVTEHIETWWVIPNVDLPKEEKPI